MCFLRGVSEQQGCLSSITVCGEVIVKKEKNCERAVRKAKVKGKEGSVPPLENIQVWLDASGMIAEATSSASRERGNPLICQQGEKLII